MRWASATPFRLKRESQISSKNEVSDAVPRIERRSRERIGSRDAPSEVLRAASPASRHGDGSARHGQPKDGAVCCDHLNRVTVDPHVQVREPAMAPESEKI